MKLLIRQMSKMSVTAVINIALSSASCRQFRSNAIFQWKAFTHATFIAHILFVHTYPPLYIYTGYTFTQLGQLKQCGINEITKTTKLRQIILKIDSQSWVLSNEGPKFCLLKYFSPLNVVQCRQQYGHLQSFLHCRKMDISHARTCTSKRKAAVASGYV